MRTFYRTIPALGRLSGGSLAGLSVAV